MYTWRTEAETGLIKVRDDGGEEFTPTLHDPLQIAVLLKGIEQYQTMFDEQAAKYGHDWKELASMANRESGFNKRAFRLERHKDGTPRYVDGRLLTGIGLFQLTHPDIKGHYTDEQLYDPLLNTILACQHLANLKRRAQCQVNGKADFVLESAAFNAGSVRPPDDAEHQNKWNLHCSLGHITAEVCAFNFLILRNLEQIHVAAANALALQFAPSTMLDENGVAIPFDPDAIA